jgi:cell pole-organizing protein PopZ
MEEILASIRRIIADDDALPLARRPAPGHRAHDPVSSKPAPPVMPEQRPDAAAPMSSPRHPGAAPAIPAPPIHLVAVPDLPGPHERQETPSDSAVAPVQLDALEHAMEEYAARDRQADIDKARAANREFQPDESGPTGTIWSASEPQTGGPAPRFAEPERENREPPRLVSPSTDASVASSFQSLATSMFLRDSDLIGRTAREMLRPMLKQWLDDNLPAVVERLVRAEIERVARGAR